MNKFKRRWFPKKPICDGGVRDFRTVGLQEIKPALFLLLIGVSLSVIIMLIELCTHMLMQRTWRKRIKASRKQRTTMNPKLWYN